MSVIQWTADDGWTVWPAPAKLNLFLHLTGRREDGYHLLETVFQLLDWGDRVALKPREDGQIIRHRGGEGVSSEEDLVVRAAIALKRAAGTPWGAEIDVEKVIPQGGGFGGGSSNAATVLVALNYLWNLNFSLDALAEIGLTLGADVPVFVHGRSAYAEGIGEVLTPLKLPNTWYLVVNSGVSVPTAELFRSKDLTRDTSPARIAGFVSGVANCNAFEPVLRRQSSKIAEVLDWLSAFGHAKLTGTGGGTFVAFEDFNSAKQVQYLLKDKWQNWIVRGVDVSPLHEQLVKHSIQNV